MSRAHDLPEVPSRRLMLKSAALAAGALAAPAVAHAAPATPGAAPYAVDPRNMSLARASSSTGVDRRTRTETARRPRTAHHVDLQHVVPTGVRAPGTGRDAAGERVVAPTRNATTHTAVHGATVYAGLVRDELLARHLVPEGAVRVG